MTAVSLKKILRDANKKFTKRWKNIELLVQKNNLSLDKITPKEYDILWRKSKKQK